MDDVRWLDIYQPATTTYYIAATIVATSTEPTMIKNDFLFQKIKFVNHRTGRTEKQISIYCQLKLTKVNISNLGNKLHNLMEDETSIQSTHEISYTYRK